MPHSRSSCLVLDWAAAALYALWKYTAQMKTNQAAEGKAELEKFLASQPASPNWHVTLSQYILGKIDDEALLKAANGSADVLAKAQWLCEARYFQGVKVAATQPKPLTVPEVEIHLGQIASSNHAPLNIGVS